MQPVKTQKYIDINKPFAFREFTDTFTRLLEENMHDHEDVVILCIGTDRSTGDCFGPLIGYKLGGTRYEDVFVYGTLDNPVHAKNLKETVSTIYSTHKRPLIIAIDACLGSMDHIGCITLGKGSIKPGSGVNKCLPEVGDIFITGIVNISGFMEFIVLQNTRLNLVMKMADVTSLGIRYGIWKAKHQTSRIADATI